LENIFVENIDNTEVGRYNALEKALKIILINDKNQLWQEDSIALIENPLLNNDIKLRFTPDS
jgi:hypothetical protein